MSKQPGNAASPVCYETHNKAAQVSYRNSSLSQGMSKQPHNTAIPFCYETHIKAGQVSYSNSSLLGSACQSSAGKLQQPQFVMKRMPKQPR